MGSTFKKIDISDIEQLREELVGWETEPVQLSRGPLDLELTTSDIGNCSLLQLAVGPRIADRSVVHAGTIGFVLAERPQMWCGMDIEPTSLLIMHSGREMRSVLGPNFRSVEFYYRERDIADHPLGHTLLSNSRDPERSVVRVTEQTVNLLHVLANAINTDANASVHEVSAQWFHSPIQQRILDLLLSIIQPRFENSPHEAPKRRRPRSLNLTFAALEQIERADDGAISVSDLHSQLGVSGRTLELAFSDVLGISPAQYILAYRLNFARCVLLTKGERVSTTAELAGFRDGSRFAYQYRRLFGELPSQTLSRRLERHTAN
jgi:AraC family ethanolamine operon transcriptional activator